MLCSSCRRENREDAKFCDGCGAPLACVCSNCRASLRALAHFCDACGHAVSTLPESASTLPASPARTQGQSEPDASGPGGVGWRPSTYTSQQAPGPSPREPSKPTDTPITVVAQPHQKSVRYAIVGEVRGFQARQETHTDAFTNKTTNTIIWTFRLERYDKTGNRLQPVPVEMRGRSFEGFINDGDLIGVPGKWKEGRTVRPDCVSNLTNGAMVQASSRKSAGEAIISAWAKLWLALAIIGVLAFIILGLLEFSR
jgi:Double zinc ribbon